MAEFPKLDCGALYTALDSRRRVAGLSWRSLSDEMGLPQGASIFTRLSQGRQPSLPSAILMTRWLGAAVEDFVALPRPSTEEAQRTVDEITRYLHADRALDPHSANAIDTIVRAAYEQMVSNEEQGK